MDKFYPRAFFPSKGEGGVYIDFVHWGNEILEALFPPGRESLTRARSGGGSIDCTTTPPGRESPTRTRSGGGGVYRLYTTPMPHEGVLYWKNF